MFFDGVLEDNQTVENDVHFTGYHFLLLVAFNIYNLNIFLIYINKIWLTVSLSHGITDLTGHPSGVSEIRER